MFQKAIKQEAKLRLAIAGPSGSGKTFTALAIAEHLTIDKPIALVDTEHGSASKYADIFGFDVLNLEPPFHPDRIIEAIRDAQVAGYGVIILDSMSHVWSGTGGILDMVDDIAARSNSKNTFTAWKQGTPIYNRMIDAIIQSDIHVIATMRSKQDYILTEKEKDGRKYQTPEKVGMAPVQRDGFEYEFDIMLTLDAENNATVTKTRCSALQGGFYRKPGAEIAKIMREWLSGSPVQEMTFADACAMKSVTGALFADASDENLRKLEVSNSISVTAKMKKAARIILDERERMKQS